MKKVTAGETVTIRATDWNAMLDAAQAEKNRRNNGGAHVRDFGFGPGIVFGRNGTGNTLVPGNVAVADGFSVAPVNVLDVASAVVDMVLPAEDDSRAMAVSLDVCQAGGLGRFLVTGPVLVNLARLPSPDEPFVGFGPGGALLPGQTGQARILASGTDFSLILIGAGHVADPPARGMFQLLNATAQDGPPTVRICDGAMPESATAGVATINQQSYSCPAAEFALTAAPQFFYLRFTPPQTTSGGEQTASACDLVAMPDTSAVVSTDQVLYRLIGHAWTETAGDVTRVRIVQDHPVGNLVTTWYGPCIGLLDGIVES